MSRGNVTCSRMGAWTPLIEINATNITLEALQGSSSAVLDHSSLPSTL